MENLFNDIKNYLNDFKYDLIILSDKRIIFKNQKKNEFIQIRDDILIIDLLEYVLNNDVNLSKIFNNTVVKFSTDYYLKSFLDGSIQIV